MLRRLACTAALAALAAASLPAQSLPVAHGVRPAGRLAIRNATIVDGNGTPARGPADIVIEGNTIAEVVWLDPVALKGGRARRPAADAEIDATGKFVLPGLINVHAHVQDSRGGVPQPVEYALKTWLATGITTVREVGNDSVAKLLALRARAARGEVASPRIFVYAMFNNRPMPRTPAEARARVREYKGMGADGMKMLGVERDLMAAALDEAHTLGLRVAHHAGVEETDAWDDARLGTTSIEHWYGIPDAAIPDRQQRFPSDYNYNDETDRFRWAGHLWREADPAILSRVLDTLVAAKVAWVPTLDIYEASRDLQRAQTQPWFREWLHPTLEAYFKPDAGNHGSYFFGWSSTDETYWKENYRLWMAALRDFDRKGGLIGIGDDAGFIYQLYGFGMIRSMELHQEAGFHPITIIQQATGNNARILGEESRLGRVRAGWLADLIVVDGNPLEDLKMLYPDGGDVLRDGKVVHAGGVEWTIKDGIPYHGPTLRREVKALVAAARAQR
ncbi:MAG TPA: amidohydrolase family protein [Gemmatimonadaceae bacterium]